MSERYSDKSERGSTSERSSYSSEVGSDHSSYSDSASRCDGGEASESEHEDVQASVSVNPIRAFLTRAKDAAIAGATSAAPKTPLSTSASNESITVVPAEVTSLVEELAHLKIRIDHCTLQSDDDTDDDSDITSTTHIPLPPDTPPAIHTLVDNLHTGHIAHAPSDLIARLSTALTTAARTYGSASIANAHRLGGDDADEGRAFSQAISNELELIHGLGAHIIAAVDRRAVDSFHDAVCLDLISKTSLLFATPAPRWSARASSMRSSTPEVRVWASLRDARSSVLSDAVSAATDGEEESTGTPYAVFVVVDASIEAGVDAGALLRTQQRGREEMQVLAEWAAVCDGLADCRALAAASAAHAVRALSADPLRRARARPVLVVLHASAESFVSDGAAALRVACENAGARLCVEGGALVALAQKEPPGAAAACLRSAHALVMDPGAWLGFAGCAALTMQTERVVEGDTQRVGAKVYLPERHDSDARRAIAPALALWWVLARLGCERVQGVVEGACRAADALVQRVRAVDGLDAVIGGCGSAVRVSFAPEAAAATAAAAAPGALAACARARVGRVNRVLYAEAKRSCDPVLVALEGRAGDTWLSYAPASVVRARGLWAPTKEAVDQAADALEMVAHRVRVCESARGAFNRAARQNGDIEAAVFGDEFVGDVMCFASFRVVPHTFDAEWTRDSARAEKVERWTCEVYNALERCFDELVKGDRKFKRKVETVAKMRGSYLSILARLIGKSGGQIRTQGKGTDARTKLPFSAFLKDDQVADEEVCWIGLAPTDDCKVVDGEMTAEIAAELISYATDSVLGEERGSNVLV